MFDLRPYQERMILAGLSDISELGRALWWAPTGAGKNVCIAELCRRYISENRKSRILIIVDQTILVSQLYQTFRIVNPDVNVDVACAGIKSKFDQYSKVIIASRQTISARSAMTWNFDLVIFDEAHCLGLLNGDGGLGDTQFHGVLGKVFQENRDAAILGCTATPYRLKEGIIYGAQKETGEVPIFPRVSCKITYRELFDDGYLTEPIFIKQTVIDRNEIKKDARGEYVQSDAAKSINRHTESAFEAYDEVIKRYSPSRPICFCSTIDHAKDVAEIFRLKGVKAYEFHSLNDDSDGNLDKFRKDGGLLVTVNRAIKGFDFPPLDMIIGLRITACPSVCIQMVGRALRVSQGKERAIVVDLVGNTDVHIEGNDLDRPVVKEPRKKEVIDEDIITLQSGKRCGNFPECRELLKTGVMQCPKCGYQFPPKELKNIPIGELVEFSYGQSERIIDIDVKLISKVMCTSQVGKRYVNVLITCTKGVVRRVSLFFRDQYGASPAVFATSKRWGLLHDSAAPKNTDFGCMLPMARITKARMRMKNGFWDIISVERRDKNSQS